MWRAEQLKAKRQCCGTPPVGEEAEMVDAHETLREDVQEEAAQELVDGQGHEFLFVAVGGIAPTKSDLASR